MSLNKKGFTLIELLVVIAIIGILASIVLTSLNDARNKGYDTQIKSDVAQIRNALEIYYDDNGGTYTGFTWAANTPNLKAPNCSANAGSYNVVISAGGDAYSIYSDLCAATNDWCVDSTGYAKITAAAGTSTCL